MLDYFRKFIRTYLSFGLERTNDPLEYQRVVLVNTLTLIIQGFIIVLVGAVVAYQIWVHVIIGILCFFLIKPSYFLNQRGLFKWAALYMVNFCVIGILVASYFAFYESRFSETENWLYAFIAISIFLFDGAIMRFHFWLITLLLLAMKVLKFELLNLPMGQDFVFLLVNTIILSLGLYVFLLIFKFGLRRSLKKLEEADKMKNRLFSIVAHDLKSPFTLFETMLEASKTEVISKEEFLDLRKNLQDKFEPLKHTVHGLLEWSQVQLNHIQPGKETFDAVSELKTVMQFFQVLSEKKEVEIIIDGSSSEICMDPQHFHMIIRNLVHNAIKFSPRGERVVLSVEDRKEEVVICVGDHGNGMEPSIVEKVLQNEPVNSSRGTEGESGTGLGLNLTRELVERNGLRMEIETEKGKGTTLMLHIPKINRTYFVENS